MKIHEAKQLYSTHLNALRSRKQELTKLLEEDGTGGPPRYDRVELSKELSQVEREYGQTQGVMEQLQLKEMVLHNAEAAKQQGEAVADAMDNMAKCLEIARRIGEGAKVPAADEKLLMEYSHELYMAAKNMALLHLREERKEYDSLLEEEEPQEAEKDPHEIAGEGEAGVAAPEALEPMEPTEAEPPA